MSQTANNPYRSQLVAEARVRALCAFTRRQLDQIYAEVGSASNATLLSRHDLEKAIVARWSSEVTAKILDMLASTLDDEHPGVAPRVRTLP